MLKVIRKNKRFANRKLMIYDGVNKIAEVEPNFNYTHCWWYARTNTSIPRHVFMEQYFNEVRIKIMENLYWLLGRGCDKKTWAESIEYWNSVKGALCISRANITSLFHNIYEMDIAIDSFNDVYYKED